MPVQLTDAQRRTILRLLARENSAASVPGQFASQWSTPKITIEDVHALNPARGMLLKPGEIEYFREEAKAFRLDPDTYKLNDPREQVIQLSSMYYEAKDRGSQGQMVTLLAEIRTVDLAVSSSGDVTPTGITRTFVRPAEPFEKSDDSP